MKKLSFFLLAIFLFSSALKAQQNSTGSNDNNYATLYLYRFYNGMAIQPYGVKLNDSLICYMESGSAFEVKIAKTGKVLLTAKTESTRKLELNLKPGEKYYILCTLDPGFMQYNANLKLVSNEKGEKQYAEVKAKQKK